MVKVWKKVNGFIKIIIIVSFTLIISLNPRIEKLNFGFQTKKFQISTEVQYEIQDKKVIEALNLQ